MREIRAGQGFGDSLYLQSVVKYFLSKGQNLIVRSNHPDVFTQLPVEVVPFRRDRGNCIIAHYVQRKHLKDTDQWQDLCISAGVKEPLEMSLDWSIKDSKNIQIVQEFKKPVVAVLLPRKPMDRNDNFADEMIPNFEIIGSLIKQDSISKIQIGAGDALYKYKYIDLDLANKTKIRDVLDIASQVDGFVGWCSFMLPLAESLQKPFFSLWSHKGFKSHNGFINTLRPEKVIHRKDLSYHAIDDWPQDKIQDRFNDFLREVTRRADIRKQTGLLSRVGAGSIGQSAGLH